MNDTDRELEVLGENLPSAALAAIYLTNALPRSGPGRCDGKPVTNGRWTLQLTTNTVC
jgi:hypothetical protein